jgi:hypothetical protein
MQEIGQGGQRRPSDRYPDDQRYPNDQRYPDNQRDPNAQRYPNDQRYPDNQRDPNAQRYPNDQRYPDQDGRRQRVAYPSSRFRNYTGSYFRIAVPDNWRELPSNDGVTFAPEGAYSQVQGQFVFTHGVQVGAVSIQSNSLKSATDQLIRALSQGNQNLRRNGGYENDTIGRRDALSVSLTNISELTGRRELITLFTTLLRSGELFYVIAVAPENEIQDYQRTFTAVLGTVSVND